MTTKKKAGGRPKLAEYQKRTKSCQVMFNESARWEEASDRYSIKDPFPRQAKRYPA